MDRRGFLKGLTGLAAAGAAMTMLPKLAAAGPSSDLAAIRPIPNGLLSTEMGAVGARAVRIIHPYGEGQAFERVYWRNGRYEHDALAEFRHFFRDRRKGLEIDVDPALLDLLHDFVVKADIQGPMHLISGYRADAVVRGGRRRKGRGIANAGAVKGGSGRARRDSMHAFGMAIDITVPGRPMSELREIAWDMQRGGVGFYGNRGFMHLDIGEVRRWGWGAAKSGAPKKRSSQARA